MRSLEPRSKQQKANKKWKVNKNMIEGTEFRVKITFTDDVLGMTPSDPEIHRKYIASNAPDALTTKQEVAAKGIDAVVQEGMTIFPKNADGQPFFWDYQIRGMFKDSCGLLRKVKTTKSSAVTAYKKKIDGTIFVKEREIPIELSGEIKSCQRPLRGSTPQGETISLANSESIPAGSSITFTVYCLDEKDIPLVKEWLDYGELHGMGQWRNSGKGRFIWKEV